MPSMRSLSVLLALSALACGKNEKTESEPSAAESSGAEENLTPEETKTLLGALVAKEMCKPEGYFASCGSFQPGECEKTTSDSLGACLDENPAWLETLNEDETSQALGMCTAKGALLKVASEGRLSTDGKCADPDQFP